MHLALVTPPAETPVSLAEAKAHLRVTSTAEDALVAALVAAATQHIEGRQGVLGRALVTQTWDARFDGFPRGLAGRIELPLPPLQSVTSVKYVNGAGDEITIDASTYVVDAQHPIGRIRPAYNMFWPAPRPEEGSVRVRFVAGYGAAAAVPVPLKQAILLLVGHWYAHREAVGTPGAPMALAVEALLAPYRQWSA